MPGLLMHLAEGEIILNHINNIKDRKLFMLGCILPDVTCDKALTHFRPDSQKNLITKYPDMDYVLNKYKNKKLSPIDMGILAHLHLDACYVKDFWPHFFNFEDKCERKTCDIRNGLFVRVYSRNNEIVPLKTFFSNEYFYGEYDILNPIIYKKYKPFIPVSTDYDTYDIHIKECIPENKKAVDISLKKYLPAFCFDDEAVVPASNSSLKIFSQNEIFAFLEESALSFISMCKELFYSASV